MTQLELRTAAGHRSHPRMELVDLRRRTMMLRRWVGPQRDVVARLAADQGPLFDDAQRLRLRNEENRSIRYVEDLNDLRERASAKHDEISQQLTEDLNRTMYILAAITAIFLPLALLISLIAVDLEGIPGTELDGVALVFVLFVLAVVLSYVFWRARVRFF